MKAKLKHKIGDHVVITDNNSEHGFETGEEVIITKLFPDEACPYFTAANEAGDWWAINDDECERLPNRNLISTIKMILCAVIGGAIGVFIGYLIFH